MTYDIISSLLLYGCLLGSPDFLAKCHKSDQSRTNNNHMEVALLVLVGLVAVPVVGCTSIATGCMCVHLCQECKKNDCFGDYCFCCQNESQSSRKKKLSNNEGTSMHLSLVDAIFSIFTGAVTALGFGILYHRSLDSSVGIKYFIGGGVLNLGFYFWSPAEWRRSWTKS